MNRPLVARLLEEFCTREGLRLELDDALGNAGCIIAPNSRRSWFVGTRFDLNPLGASELIRDKGYTVEFLQKHGYPVPRSHVLLARSYRHNLMNKRPGYVRADKNPERALEAFITEAGYPLYLKPNTGSGGRDIERVETDDELQDSLQRLSGLHETLLLQEEVSGQDLRIMVLDGDILCALIRSHPSLTGDGKTSVADLLGEPVSSRIERELQRQGVAPDTVLPKNKILRLLPVANLGAQGHAEILPTDMLAPSLKSLAQGIAELFGLRYCAIDLIVDEPTTQDTIAKILEVNAAPGLAELHRQGGDAAALVVSIYEKLFQALKQNLLAC